MATATACVGEAMACISPKMSVNMEIAVDQQSKFASSNASFELPVDRGQRMTPSRSVTASRYQ
jgi:hypothetical protein